MSKKIWNTIKKSECKNLYYIRGTIGGRFNFKVKNLTHIRRVFKDMLSSVSFAEKEIDIIGIRLNLSKATIKKICELHGIE